MRIAIATSGRFHVLDLARELFALGHSVTFYSLLPKGRVADFGFPRGCHRSFFLRTLPFLGCQRLVRNPQVNERLDRLIKWSLDARVAKELMPCDVFIGMSGIFLKAGMVAQRRYQALFLLERGSRHVLSQKEILESIPSWPRGKPGVPPFDVNRELAGYEVADYVVVPSRHVAESFLERGYPAHKVFRNPYGVDLRTFRPTPPPQSLPPTIIFVGTWSLRKGADILTAASRKLSGVRLLHVGSIGDAPLPKAPGFEHHQPAPQNLLPHFYSRAHVFALASREEGLSLVLSQALACGLPVVCTDRTGGYDLKEMLNETELVTVVPHDNVNALADGLSVALQRASQMRGMRDGLGDLRHRIGWAAYGRRYDNFLTSILGK